MNMLRNRSSWLVGRHYLRENGSARYSCYDRPMKTRCEGESIQQKRLASIPHSSTIVKKDNAHEASACCPDDQQSTLGMDPGRDSLVRRCRPVPSRRFLGFTIRRPMPALEQPEEFQYFKSRRSSFGLLYLKLFLPQNLQLRADLPCKGRYYGVPAYQDADRQSDCEASDIEGDSAPTSLEFTDFQSKSIEDNSGSAVGRNCHESISAHRRTSSGFCKVTEQRPRSGARDLSELTSQKPTPFHVYKVLREQNDAELAWQFFVWAGQQQGFEHNAKTYNSMILTFCTARKFKDVLELLETMRRNGVYVQNWICATIMKCLADAKMYEEAIRVFDIAKASGCTADAMLYSHYLSVIVKAGHFGRLDVTFAQMQSAGCVPTVYTYKILINGFGKAGKVEKACQFYEEMKAKGCVPNIYTYNTLLYSLGMAGKTDKALQLFGEIMESGVVPALETYNILKSIFSRDCTVRSASDTLKQRQKGDSDPRTITYHSLIPLLCNEQDLDSALQMLRDMESQGCVPVFIYNLVLFSLWKAEREDTVLDLFRTLKDKGCVPDNVSYKIVLNLFWRAGRVEEAVQLHEEIVGQGLVPDTWLSNMLIDLLASSGQVDRAWQVFLQMKGCTPDGYTYNILMSTLCNVRNPKKMLAWLKRAGVTTEFLTTRSQGILILLQRMKEVAGPDTIMHNTFMRTLCKSSRVDEAHSLLLDMQKNNLVPGLKAYISVLELLGSSGQISKAWKLFLRMDTNADLIAYSIMVKYLGRAGSFGKAYKLLEEMKRGGFAPDVITYTTLIGSLGRAGKLDKMFSLFKEMQADGCQPNKFTYSCLVRWFANAGQIDMAYKLFEESIDKGCIPDVYSYNSIIGGYFKASRSNEALNLYVQMINMGCIATEGTYAILYEGFRKDGRSDLASEVLTEMTSRGYSFRPHFSNAKSASLKKSEQDCSVI